MVSFLDELEETANSGVVSVYMAPELSPEEIEDLSSKRVEQSVSDELVRLTSSSRNGAVLFWSSDKKYLILPPFPVRETAVLPGCVTEPLRGILDSEFIIGFVLLHLGSYAVGLCRGDTLLSSKVGTGLIHGRHRKGGSSQQRFQRRREEQAERFIDRVCQHAREHLEPYRDNLDYIVYGGPRQTVLLLRKRCRFLGTFDDRVLPLLDVPAVRRKVLETTVYRVWSSRIIEWYEDA